MRPLAENLPELTFDGSPRTGLRIGRKLLVDLNDAGIPVACEMLDTISCVGDCLCQRNLAIDRIHSPQFLSDTISWAAIGARTTESQLHRELASGVSFPVGFKNATAGSVGIAIDAIRSASCPHAFLGINTHGLAAIVRTQGNRHLHVILRGSSDGPNYSAEHVKKARDALKKAIPNSQPSIMVSLVHPT